MVSWARPAGADRDPGRRRGGRIGGVDRGLQLVEAHDGRIQAIPEGGLAAERTEVGRQRGPGIRDGLLLGIDRGGDRQAELVGGNPRPQGRELDAIQSGQGITDGDFLRRGHYIRDSG